ncbi:unnamed protein product, partial [Ectocarpus sp. 12 AP-2014]
RKQYQVVVKVTPLSRDRWCGCLLPLPLKLDGACCGPAPSTRTPAVAPSRPSPPSAGIACWWSRRRCWTTPSPASSAWWPPSSSSSWCGPCTRRPRRRRTTGRP